MAGDTGAGPRNIVIGVTPKNLYTHSMKRKSPNYLPGPADYDHEPLLEALRIAREELVKYRSAVGSKLLQDQWQILQ